VTHSELALHSNCRIGLKGLPGTNTLAYLPTAYVPDEEKLNKLSTELTLRDLSSIVGIKRLGKFCNTFKFKDKFDQKCSLAIYIYIYISVCVCVYTHTYIHTLARPIQSGSLWFRP
jgi:hypothetical protein